MVCVCVCVCVELRYRLELGTYFISFDEGKVQRVGEVLGDGALATARGTRHEPDVLLLDGPWWVSNLLAVDAVGHDAVGES
jgi:hypothetical protein